MFWLEYALANFWLSIDTVGGCLGCNDLMPKVDEILYRANVVPHPDN